MEGMITGRSGQVKAQLRPAENPNVHHFVWEYLDLRSSRKREAGKRPGWWGCIVPCRGLVP